MRTTFPIKVSCSFAILFLVVGTLNNLPLTSALVILSSFTSDILYPKFFLHFYAGILPAWREGMRAVPRYQSPKGGDCMGFPENQILGFEIHLWITPITQQPIYGGRCGSNPAVHIMFIAQILWNVTLKVLEVPCECDMSLLKFYDGGVWWVIMLLVLPLTFLFFISCLTLAVMEEYVVVLLLDFGRVGKVKYPGVGKNTHSVFESLFFFRMCNSGPNFANCRRIRGVTISNWCIDSNKNAPSST